MKLLSILLSAVFLVACGGGDETPVAVIKTSVPHPVANAATVTGGSTVAIHMYQALYGMAPSNAMLIAHTAQATADPSAFARNLANNFASTSSTALAKLVLDNLNVTAATVTAVNGQGQSEYAILLDALGQMFTFYGADARGQIILNATNLFAGLESDATYGPSAASYNYQATANFVYGSNAANTIPSTVSTATAKAIEFDKFTGGWTGIANSKQFSSDSLKLNVSISSNVVTVRAEQFFDGTCEYKANLNTAHDAVSAGSYQCSDFTTGSWILQEMLRVDQGDVYIRLQKDGSVDKRFYGLALVGTKSVMVISDPISTLAGTYDAIATGSIFGTDRASNSNIEVNGTTLTITLARFFAGTCKYTATIQADGVSISTPTYRCSDFSTGTWSLNDLRVIGGSDFYLSVLSNGFLERAYGMKRTP